MYNKFGKTISVNGCFSSSNIGQMTGFIAREIVKGIPNAFMRYPLALTWRLRVQHKFYSMINYNIVIDECKS